MIIRENTSPQQTLNGPRRWFEETLSCDPAGWHLRTRKMQPITTMVAVLTLAEAEETHPHSLVFFETVSGQVIVPASFRVHTLTQHSKRILNIRSNLMEYF